MGHFNFIVVKLTLEYLSYKKTVDIKGFILVVRLYGTFQFILVIETNILKNIFCFIDINPALMYPTTD